MSAWIVTKSHIDAMLTAGMMRHGKTDCGFGWIHPKTGNRMKLDYSTANAVGAMLWAENYKSVNFRYSENEEVPEYSFDEYLGPVHLSPGAVAKIIHCYEYQTCEHPEWRDSEAFAFCAALGDRMLTMLPDYERAPWGIDDPFAVTA